MPVVVNHFHKLAAEARPKARLLLVKVATDAQGVAQQNSRVDTGAMEAAWQLDWRGPFAIALVNGQDYAVFNETGTVNMAAQPMLKPAIDGARLVLPLALQALVRL